MVAVVGTHALGDQDQRLRPVQRLQSLEDGAEHVEGGAGLAAKVHGDLAGLHLQVREAFGAVPLRHGRRAFALLHLVPKCGVAVIHVGDRLRDAHAVAQASRPPHHLAQRFANLGVLGRELHADPRGEGHEARSVVGVELVEQMVGGLQHGAAVAEADVALVDGDEEQASRPQALVGAEVGGRRGRLRLVLALEVHEVGGEHGPGHAADGHLEVLRREPPHGPAGGVDDAHVHRDDVHLGLEDRGLLLGQHPGRKQEEGDGTHHDFLLGVAR